MKTFKSLAVSLAVAIGTLTAASAASAADYAVILKTLSNPYWQAIKTGVENKAKELDVSVDVFAAPSEDDTQAQLQLFEDVLNRDYKAIIFAPISPVNLVQPAAEAYKKNIPLINIDESVDVAALKQAGANIQTFITTDNKMIGANGANYIIKALGEKGGEVAIIEGKPGVASNEGRKSGAADAFAKTSNVKLVASQPADFDRLKALDVASNILQSSPDLKAFYCVNDTMALGVVQAVQNAGRSGDVIVVGTDGAPEARESIKAGRLTATVGQNPEKIGADSLVAAVAAAKSGKLIAPDADAPQVNVDSAIVTKD